MIEEVKIPEISENVESGTIIRVLVGVGDMIDIDDVLVEFETEKALVDIPSTMKGKITELLAKEGAEMKVGDVIARVDTESRSDQSDTAESEPAADEAPKKEADTPKESPPAGASEEVKAEVDQKQKDASQAPQIPAVAPQPAVTQKKIEDHPADQGPAPAAPSVRRFARELGVDIYAVKASGPGSRITEDDVKSHVQKGQRPDKTAGAKSRRLSWMACAASPPPTWRPHGAPCRMSPNSTRLTLPVCRNLSIKTLKRSLKTAAN